MKLLLCIITILSFLMKNVSTDYSKAFFTTGNVCPTTSEGLAIIKTNDGGYVSVGLYGTTKDYLVTKFDSFGNLEWDTRVETTQDFEQLHGVVETDDGHIVAGGYTFTGLVNDMSILQLKSTGEVEFLISIGDSYNEVAYDFRICNDSGYILIGYRDGPEETSLDISLVKLDSSFEVEWCTVVGSDGSERGMRGQQTSDGGFIVTGYTNSDSLAEGTSGYDIFIAKYDFYGGLTWFKTIGEPGSNVDDKAAGVTETRDGGYAIVGWTAGIHIVVVRLDSLGEQIWARKVSSAGVSDYGRNIIEVNDRGFVISGMTDGYGTTTDSLLVKLDKDGNLVWALANGTKFVEDYARDLLEDFDSSIVVTGSREHSDDCTELYLSKVDPNGDGCFWNDATSVITVEEWTVDVKDYTGFVDVDTDYIPPVSGPRTLNEHTNTFLSTAAYKCHINGECHGVMADDQNACGPNGDCLGYNYCDCDDNYLGDYCNVTSCFGKFNNQTEIDVCSNHGTCEVYNQCQCSNIYYFGLECNVTTCNGIFSNDTLKNPETTELCGGKDYSTTICWPYNSCECLDNYYGIGGTCNVTTCYEKYSNDTSVCSDFGECWPFQTCQCEKNYFGDECDVTMCYDGVYSNDSDFNNLCSGHGLCWPFHTCTCTSYYFGEICNITTCNGYLTNDTTGEVCTSHGLCEEFEKCTCSNFELYEGDYCQNWKCHDIWNYQTDTVCSNHGNCSDFDRCDCEENYYGIICNITTCDGVFNNDTENSQKSCSSRGVCSDYNDCTCFPHVLRPTSPYCSCVSGIFGDNCSVTTCDGIFSNTSEVCTERGDCNLDSRKCDCFSTNYTGDFCGEWDCFNVKNYYTQTVCSGHGECVDFDTCNCVSSQYGGLNCEQWTCNNTQASDIDNVCAGHGYCLGYDDCYCISGYYKPYSDGICSEWQCGSYHKDDSLVCNERGVCHAAHLCTCDDEYEGALCETWSCGLDHEDPRTCSGHGRCISPDICVCNSGWGGETCMTDKVSDALLATFLPILGIIIIMGIFCMICCCCCFGICLSFGVFFLIGLVFWQMNRMRKYRRLKNFDVLLKEQELEDDMTVAHLRINKKLFEVNFDEIKIDKMLGEGGSNSVVFKASWNNSEVAFKCFKTRIICSSQIKFDEFEREVEVLANVSHPNIVRFFGATIEKPRVGILMEFCCNGDMIQFLHNYKDKQHRIYPFSEKLRMMYEVISAMEYLHSRNIIHRDLKLENVLIDEEHHCKVMDFGLSTIVERMSQQKTTRIGTNIYMAPEVLNESQYTSKCDVFGFGIFVYIFLTEIWEPYGRESEETQIELRVCSDPNFRPVLEKFDEIVPESTGLLKWVRNDVMVRCWDHDPLVRPEFSDLNQLFSEKMEQLEEMKFEYKEIRSEGLDNDGDVEDGMDWEDLARELERELVLLKKNYSTKGKKKR